MEPVSAGWRQIVLRRMFISQSNLQGKASTLNNLFAYVCHAPLRFQIVRRDASENAETLLKSKKKTSRTSRIPFIWTFIFKFKQKSSRNPQKRQKIRGDKRVDYQKAFTRPFWVFYLFDVSIAEQKLRACDWHMTHDVSIVFPIFRISVMYANSLWKIE